MAARPSKAKKSRGLYLALEGLDGAGTSTQCQRLAEFIRHEGYTVVTTAEPSQGPIGVLIRNALKQRIGLPRGQGALTDETFALLFAADRVDHYAAEVKPALDQGHWVISDRSFLSSLAYQGARVGMDWVAAINDRMPSPMLTLFLNVKVSAAEGRRKKRGGKADIFENRKTQEATAKQYQQAIAWRRKLGDAIVYIDGGADVETVTRRCLDAIAAAVSL
jgi:dTMP kinase